MSSSGSRATSLQKGKLVVISGPSGAGKTSICNALLTQVENAYWSVSATTRPLRRGDVEGESYQFVSQEEFLARKGRDEFLESAEYIGHHYGTPREPVVQAIAEGKVIILEIDVQGGIQIAAKMPESVRIFVLPPNSDSLRARLEGRNSEADDVLAKRLANADGEIAAARDSDCYPYFVVNDILEDTIEQVKSIILKEGACA